MPEQLFAKLFVNAGKRSLTLACPPLCDRAFVMRGSSRSVFLVGLILESSSGHGIERPRRGIAGSGIVYCEFFTDVFKSFGECVGSIDVGCHRVFCSGLRNNALSDAAEETADRRTGRMILVDRHILHLAAGDGHAAVTIVIIGRRILVLALDLRIELPKLTKK